MIKNSILLLLFATVSIASFAQTSKKTGKKQGSLPSLCNCLTAKGGNPSMDIPKGCKQVIYNRYGTTRPSMEQMRSDYYGCQ